MLLLLLPALLFAGPCLSSASKAGSRPELTLLYPSIHLHKLLCPLSPFVRLIAFAVHLFVPTLPCLFSQLVTSFHVLTTLDSLVEFVVI